ncbi:MAG: hypothetical protein JXC32_17830, partial [Anaerolineae bacterium]|nr:hypothetical protein [Anaerolineae bacterium]
MPYLTHGLRHDTDDLFAKLLDPSNEKWGMTPCVVLRMLSWPEEEINAVRSADELLTFPDGCQVICGWPGARRQDVFEFTVGQFRAYVHARDHRGGNTPMTCSDDPKPDSETGATEET